MCCLKMLAAAAAGEKEAGNVDVSRPGESSRASAGVRRVPGLLSTTRGKAQVSQEGLAVGRWSCVRCARPVVAHATGRGCGRLVLYQRESSDGLPEVITPYRLYRRLPVHSDSPSTRPCILTWTSQQQPLHTSYLTTYNQAHIIISIQARRASASQRPAAPC